MANVFGGGGSPSQSSNGASRVIPTSRETTSSSQTFSSSTNVFGAQPSTGVEGVNLRDFYTKSEVQKLLRTKADVSGTATKTYVDTEIVSLEQRISQEITLLASKQELQTETEALYESILDYLAQKYTESQYLYSKSDIDQKFSEIELNSEDLLKRSPDSTLENTIDPGSKYTVALTVKGSSHPEISSVQQWIDSENNSIGRIKSDGVFEYYGNMFLGTNIEEWRPALDVNERRIAGVADPVDRLDAVNKKYMEDTVAQVVDDVIREGNLVFTIDCKEY